MRVEWWTVALLVYAAGVIWGLIRIDAPIASRVGLAVVWPIGPIAFIITLTVLIAAAALAFPAFGALLAAGAIAGWLFWAA